MNGRRFLRTRLPALMDLVANNPRPSMPDCLTSVKPLPSSPAIDAYEPPPVLCYRSREAAWFRCHYMWRSADVATGLLLLLLVEEWFINTMCQLDGKDRKIILGLWRW